MRSASLGIRWTPAEVAAIRAAAAAAGCTASDVVRRATWHVASAKDAPEWLRRIGADMERARSAGGTVPVSKRVPSV